MRLRGGYARLRGALLVCAALTGLWAAGFGRRWYGVLGGAKGDRTALFVCLCSAMPI